MTPSQLASHLNTIFRKVIDRARELFPHLTKADIVDLADIVTQWYYKRFRLSNMDIIAG